MEISDMSSSILARGRLAVISTNLFASTEKSSDAILGTSAVFAAQPQPNVKGSLTIVDERTELLEEENVEISSWICFSSVDGVNAPSGESFKDCLDVLDKSDKVTAVGINCAPPHFVQSLIQRFKEELEKKRKERAQEVYEKKNQLTKLRVKAEKLAEEKLGSQLDIIAPVKY